MRVLGEKAALHQQFAHLTTRTERGVDVDPRPEACPANGDDTAADEAFEAGVETHPEQSRAFLGFAGGEHPDHCAADGSRQRVAPERRPVLARPQDPEDVRVADDCRHRDDAAAERFAEQVQVGDHPDEVAGERGTGASESRLDLVCDEQHIPFRADGTYRRKVVGRGH